MDVLCLNGFVLADFGSADKDVWHCGNLGFCGAGGGAGAMLDLAHGDLLGQALPAVGPRRRRYRDDLNEILYWELTRDNLPMLL